MRRNPQHTIVRGKLRERVTTVYSRGLYAVDKRYVKSAAYDPDERGLKLYVVTHTPTGASVYSSGHKAIAERAARLFNKHAGNAGKGAKRGRLDTISSSGMAKLQHARGVVEATLNAPKKSRRRNSASSAYRKHTEMLRSSRAYAAAHERYVDAQQTYRMYARIAGRLTRDERADKAKAERRMDRARAEMDRLLQRG